LKISQETEETMALTITSEPLENRQLALHVQVDQDRVDAELRKAAAKVAGEVRIPGFRKGKAPYNTVVRYVGLPALFDEFLEPLGEQVYREVLQETKLEPYAMAQLDLEGIEPLTYKYIVPLDPEIQLGDYRALRVEPPMVEIDDSDVDARLDEMREEHATYGEVNRPSQYGDMLTIDVKSVLVAAEGAADEPTVVLDETDWDITPDQENPMEPPGFDEALLGMVPGDEKDFTLTWPADSQSIYAGKAANFHVKLHKIQAHAAPALDDAFAQLIGPDFPTLGDLKASIRKELTEEAQAEAESAYLEEALDALVAQSTLVYPPVVIEDQIDVMINEFERQLRQYGIDSIQTYLRQIDQTIEQYRDSLRETAERVARRNLVISELYRLEGIEVTDEDIDARVKAMLGEGREDDAESNRALREMMLSGPGRAVLESQILNDKALDRLLAIVRGDELPPLPEPKPAAETPTVETPTGDAETAPMTADAAPAPEGAAPEPDSEV
jgi:trigger factor